MSHKSVAEDVIPLAVRMRPQDIASYIGQQHILGKDKPLYRSIEAGALHSMILWGPPGTGKTTLAEIIARSSGAHIERLSAVLSGVKDIRAVVDRARYAQDQGQATVVFVDEVHRFNKSQQDAFLPHVEQGLIVLIGATTENPSFELNNALLSRARVYVLKPLAHEDLLAIIDRALAAVEADSGGVSIHCDVALREKIALASDGDARSCLNILELALDLSEDTTQDRCITEAVVASVLQQSWRRFDKQGGQFYDQISALHKSVRGSNPDAALYWLCRMLDGGCDPHYIIRRVIRMASEDIGNADPRALTLALSAGDAFARLGSPEGELSIAQAVIYLASAPKSNACYTAYKTAMQAVKSSSSLPVPLHLKNAPTTLMKSLGYGKDYQYDHDAPQRVATGQGHFPDALGEKIYYHPVSSGLEIKIQQKLKQIRQQRRK